jgi:hypothetical protein
MQKWIFLTLLAVVLALQAQAPVYDAVVYANASYDSQVANSYGLKVASTTDRARVIVLKNAIWGMDNENRVRFQLFTDGTLHLYDEEFHETITLDGLNGQLIVNGKILAGPEK